MVRHYYLVLVKLMVAADLVCLGHLTIILGSFSGARALGPGAMEDESGVKLEKGLEGLEGGAEKKIPFPLAMCPWVLPCLSQPLFFSLRLTLWESRSMPDPQLAVSRVVKSGQARRPGPLHLFIPHEPKASSLRTCIFKQN